jgi:septal ring factor EnvC (AmiA/AmiB activator)
MFNQNPMTGPGAGSITSHSLEILLMLLVAFLIGFIFARLLVAKTRDRIDELESSVSGMGAQNFDLSNKLSKAHGENETLRRKIASVEAETSKLRGQLGELEFRLGASGPSMASFSTVTVNAAKTITTTPTAVAQTKPGDDQT